MRLFCHHFVGFLLRLCSFSHFLSFNLLVYPSLFSLFEETCRSYEKLVENGFDLLRFIAKVEAAYLTAKPIVFSHITCIFARKVANMLLGTLFQQKCHRINFLTLHTLMKSCITFLVDIIDISTSDNHLLSYFKLPL